MLEIRTVLVLPMVLGLITLGFIHYVCQVTIKDFKTKVRFVVAPAYQIYVILCVLAMIWTGLKAPTSPHIAGHIEYKKPAALSYQKPEHSPEVAKDRLYEEGLEYQQKGSNSLDLFRKNTLDERAQP